MTNAGEVAPQELQLRYFAWIREKIGRAEEVLTPPDDVTTVVELITWLRAQGPEYTAAFGNLNVVRTAIDQRHVKPDAAITGAREIAFFPPVTGG